MTIIEKHEKLTKEIEKNQDKGEIIEKIEVPKVGINYDDKEDKRNFISSDSSISSEWTSIAYTQTQDSILVGTEDIQDMSQLPSTHSINPLNDAMTTPMSSNTLESNVPFDISQYTSTCSSFLLLDVMTPTQSKTTSWEKFGIKNQIGAGEHNRNVSPILVQGVNHATAMSTPLIKHKPPDIF